MDKEFEILKIKVQAALDEYKIQSKDKSVVITLTRDEPVQGLGALY